MRPCFCGPVSITHLQASRNLITCSHHWQTASVTLVSASMFHRQGSWLRGHSVFLDHDGFLSQELIDSISGIHWQAASCSQRRSCSCDQAKIICVQSCWPLASTLMPHNHKSYPVFACLEVLLALNDINELQELLTSPGATVKPQSNATGD